VVLWHIEAVLCDVFSMTALLTDGGPTAWPPRSPDFNPLDVYLWDHLNTANYAASFNKLQTLHHRIVDTYKTVRSCLDMYERMRRFIMRWVEACIMSHGAHFEHFL
jgi:hypothetical protein